MSNPPPDSLEQSNEIMKTTAFFVEGIALLLVGIIGIVGNMAAVCVFSRQKVQRNFHCLMMALALFDMSYILVSILVFSLPQFSENYHTSAGYFYLLPWALPILQIGITGSIYCTVAITIERYFTVCHPFYRVSHSWPAAYYLTPICIFTLFYNIPKFFELTTKVPDEILSETDNSSLQVVDYDTEIVIPNDPNAYGINPTKLRLNPYYVQIYCMWLNFILMGIGPFLLLVILNSLTLRKLTTMAQETNFSFRTCHNGQSSNVHSYKRKEIILAKVSLAIVFVFFICHSVKWIPNIYELIQVGTGRLVWPHWIETITNVSHLLTTFNSSVNFYIYFAKHYKSILPEFCSPRNRRSLSDTTVGRPTTYTVVQLEDHNGGNLESSKTNPSFDYKRNSFMLTHSNLSPNNNNNNETNEDDSHIRSEVTTEF
ncbi:FMRFamide receptor [Lepeophtheirus salmonis]|nr:FMRFamide receptor-like [Lepeophtheirus salmonis]